MTDAIHLLQVISAKTLDKVQDTVFDAVTCFVIMADDFKNKDQPDL